MKTNPFCRVLHVVFRPQRRGAELVAVQLTKALDGKVESAICSIFLTKLGIPIDVDYKLGASQGRLTRTFGLNIQALWKLSRVLREYKPDIVIAHQDEAFRYVAVLKMIFRKKFIFIYQTTNVPPKKIPSKLKNRLSRVLISTAESVVCCGELITKSIIEYYNLSPDKFTSINTSIDQSAFSNLDYSLTRREMRKKLDLQQENLVLINVAALEPVKNQVEQVWLVAKLHEIGIPVHLLIIGEGKLRDILNEEIHKFSLQNFIHLLGERDDVPSVLMASDIFVLTSHKEAMAIVLMEAGLAYLPSVVYNVGGVGDVLDDGKTGILVPFGDLQELVKSVAYLCSNPKKRKEMGVAAHKKCKESFDINIVSQQYEELFEKLLN